MQNRLRPGGLVKHVVCQRRIDTHPYNFWGFLNFNHPQSLISKKIFETTKTNTNCNKTGSLYEINNEIWSGLRMPVKRILVNRSTEVKKCILQVCYSI